MDYVFGSIKNIPFYTSIHNAKVYDRSIKTAFQTTYFRFANTEKYTTNCATCKGCALCDAVNSF